MAKRLPRLLSIVLLSFLVGCATHEGKLKDAEVPQLDQESLEALFSSQRIAEFKTVKGVAGIITYYPDNRQVVQFAGIEDQGRYRIEDGRLCSTWETIRKGEKCTTFYQISDNYFELVDEDGELYLSLTFLE